MRPFRNVYQASLRRWKDVVNVEHTLSGESDRDRPLGTVQYAIVDVVQGENYWKDFALVM